MLLLALLLLATAPTPRPSPPVATVAPSATRAPLAGPQGLADAAKGRKLNRSVSFDQTTVPAAAEPTPARKKKDATGKDENAMDALIASQRAAANAAQDRMDRAVKDGLWTQENIHLNDGIKNGARNEWDAASENCRKTPGCIPAPRSNGVSKFLKTDEELMVDYAKAHRLSGAPTPRPE